MRKEIQKSILLLISMIMLFATLPVFDAAARTSEYLTYEIKNGEAKITGCNKSISGKLTIPSQIDGYPVTGIGRQAFYYCDSLTAITIPDSVKNIEDSAFAIATTNTALSGEPMFCSLTDIYVDSENTAYTSANGILFSKNKTTLVAYPAGRKGTSYTVPNSVTKIGGGAFFSSVNLKSIKILGSVTKIGSDAFAGCDSLVEIKIPDSVSSINERTFWGCRSLSSITIPDSVTSIGLNAFYCCDSLSEIKISNSVTSIGWGAFCYCGSLTSIIIPESVKTIDGYAFAYCKGLESIVIPNNATSIKYRAFTGCSSLTSITIPDSVTSIEECAFYDCYSLKSITILNKKCEIYDNKNTIPSKAKIIGYSGSTAEKYAKKYNRTFEVHTHTYKTTTVKATALKNGTKTVSCSVCGTVKSKSTIAKIKSVALSNDTFTYNGNVRKPTVTVKDSNGKTLKKDTDYTVKYSSGRKNVGKYTVTVTFKGNYSGTKKLTFKIKPKSTSIYKLTGEKKKFTAKWYTRTEQTSGYQLEYSRYSSMKNAGRKTYTTASKSTRTVSGLKAKTKYYVRVRTYKNVKIDGQTYRYYSAWSSIKQVKTK